MSYSGTTFTRNHTDYISIFSLIGIILFFLILIIGSCAVANHREYGQTFTVTGKENVKSGDSGKYLVYTDKTTYEIEDSWIFWRWDSSDVYGKIEVGKTYSATLQGYRVPFLSMYQNIIDPVVVTPETK